MRLVMERSGNGVQWVVKRTEGFEWLNSGIEGGRNTRSLDFARDDNGGTCVWDDNRGTCVWDDNGGTCVRDDIAERQRVIPWIFASVDPQEKWWLRLRGNPKRLGEVSQAAFLLKAEMLGLNLALPWGDSERYDFVVWAEDGRVIRVQVKGTGRLHAKGYEVQAVHTTRGGKKMCYTKEEIDVIAAHVQPLDAWYLIPIEEIGKAKSLRLHPEQCEGVGGLGQAQGGTRRSGSMGQARSWERWRDAWEVLGSRK